MGGLTLEEQGLFAKYWGRRDLVDDDGFWGEAFEALKERNILLPLEYTPANTRLVLEMLDCQKCGECCRYRKITLTQNDIYRIRKHIDFQPPQDGIMKECPFLKDNLCTIYEYRPDVCYFFPIQSGIEAISEGKKIMQMRIRIKCPSSQKIIREVLTEAVKQGMLLLPNLMLVST